MSHAPANLLELNPAGLERFFTDLGEKPYRARQIMKWIYHHGVDDFEAMTDIAQALRRRLGECAVIAAPRIAREQRSADGTCKWLLGLGGTNAIETVFIPEPRRGTLCISSQVGCMLNCTFCSTATQGFSRNLSIAEIVGQVWRAAQALEHTPKNRRITNVVLMGMGEPLLNFEPVIGAIELMCHDLGFGLAARRVTVSTAGLVPGIDRLRERADVSLAVSLHAPNDTLRDTLVPLNRKYPIVELLAACRRYVAGRPRSRITFEYTLMDGINDAPEHARELIKLLRTLPAKLNLIPFNPFPGTAYRRSPTAAIERFRDQVLEAGLVATVRRTRGDDIDAACGQLVGRVRDRTRRQERHRSALLARGVDPQPVMAR